MQIKKHYQVESGVVCLATFYADKTLSWVFALLG